MSELVSALFKELGSQELYIERLKMQLERQSQTIKEQAMIIEALMDAKDTH